MRIPGFRAVPGEALDEAADQLINCPVCYEDLHDDAGTNWDRRVVRSRRCDYHGYFFIKWSPVKKKIRIDWIFFGYMEDPLPTEKR